LREAHRLLDEVVNEPVKAQAKANSQAWVD